MKNRDGMSYIRAEQVARFLASDPIPALLERMAELETKLKDKGLPAEQVKALKEELADARQSYMFWTN